MAFQYKMTHTVRMCCGSCGVEVTEEYFDTLEEAIDAGKQAGFVLVSVPQALWACPSCVLTHGLQVASMPMPDAIGGKP